MDQIHVLPVTGMSGITITQNNSGLSAALSLHNGTLGGRTFSMRSTGSNDAGGIGNFMVYDNANFVPRFFIKGSNGAVGLGTTDPKAYLHVFTPAATGHGLLIEHNDPNPAGYGAEIRVKNASCRAFVVSDYTSSSNPKDVFLIYGNGKVLIGDPSLVALNGNYKLYVQNGILTERVKVALKEYADWSDYVFEKTYQLKSIDEVKQFIEKNKHLPGVPSTSELIAQGGFDLGKMDAKLLEKIEELTLYIIELNQYNKELVKKVEAQGEEIDKIKKMLK